MKILLPIQCKDLNLNDREKIFAFLMYQVALQMDSPEWMEYEYLFYARDLVHIIDKPMSEPALYRLRKIFNIATYDQQTTGVSWKNPTTSATRWYPASYEDTISDENVFVMYGYLLGRSYDRKSLFEPHNRFLKEKWGTKNASVNHLYASYRLMK